MTSTKHHSQPTFRQELTATGKLALPLAGAMLAHMGMGLTDTVMLGSVGRDALAAGGLGGSLFFMTSGVFQNVVASLAILISHARGSGDTSAISDILRAGLVLCLMLALPLGTALWFMEPFLLAIGEPPDLSADIAVYLRVIVLGAPAAMLMATGRYYLSAMNHPRVLLWISLFGLVVNGLLDYGLIYGAWGLPEMGYLGSAAATAIVMWVMALLMTIFVWTNEELKPTALLGRIDWSIFRELNTLGWPIAIIFSLETFLFTSAALLMGLLGPTALAAHQVTIMIAATAFMIPLAISQAANVRVGYHMGAALRPAARQAGFAAFVLGLGYTVLPATIMLVAPQQLAMLFLLDPDVPADAAVIAVVIDLLVICALFQIFDGAQAIAAGALRGYKDTRVPMLLGAFGYWCVGFASAWVLGFRMDYGPLGIWTGLALGLAAASVLLSWRFLVVSRRPALVMTPA